MNANMKKNAWRMLIEVGFIIFLFYSNLLMGEFERSGMARQRGLVWALSDVFTVSSLEIAVVAATIGYVLLEFLRTRF
jgi:hypothetical protein